ncbi:hypothetical protein [Jejuia pallidilutea]|uniref:DUF4890 domain-containing protein n=1 Tax=Jejuia pallidilutea TaxID=504487 RepID=A0A090W5Q1_9FLAO|nr:hypothetical protein [Jejuia pallidilutea]GAL68383.1 hypothetical protein JCM19301_1990 [Jejuia pallidilutea]GAL72345.1 hypothetical protein JCM19302_3623 [Jejuia pallidilutea]GAL89500.1 hypothetical protein JCM19538_1737 [Jejuia pallidilutea]
MKKLIFVIIICLSTTIQAQTDKNAQNVADKMTEVMDLSDTQSKKVFEMLSERNKERRELKAKYGSDKEGFKVEAKKVEQQFNKNLRNFVGNEKMKMWAKYRNELKVK